MKTPVVIRGEGCENKNVIVKKKRETRRLFFFFLLFGAAVYFLSYVIFQSLFGDFLPIGAFSVLF